MQEGRRDHALDGVISIFVHNIEGVVFVHKVFNYTTVSRIGNLLLYGFKCSSSRDSADAAGDADCGDSVPPNVLIVA